MPKTMTQKYFTSCMLLSCYFCAKSGSWNFAQIFDHWLHYSHCLPIKTCLLPRAKWIIKQIDVKFNWQCVFVGLENFSNKFPFVRHFSQSWIAVKILWFLMVEWKLRAWILLNLTRSQFWQDGALLAVALAFKCSSSLLAQRSICDFGFLAST